MKQGTAGKKGGGGGNLPHPEKKLRGVSAASPAEKRKRRPQSDGGGLDRKKGAPMRSHNNGKGGLGWEGKVARRFQHDSLLKKAFWGVPQGRRPM